LKKKNKYEESPIPLFSALMGFAIGDKEAEDYLESIGHFEEE
jgi:hypothetical protein